VRGGEEKGIRRTTGQRLSVAEELGGDEDLDVVAWGGVREERAEAEARRAREARTARAFYHVAAKLLYLRGR